MTNKNFFDDLLNGVDDFLGGLDGLFGGKTPVDPSKKTSSSSAKPSAAPIDSDRLLTALKGMTTEYHREKLERLVNHLPEDQIFKTTNKELPRAYAKACVFVGNLKSASLTYGKLDDLKENEKVVIGLIAYGNKDRSKAAKYLPAAESVPEAALALSFMHYNAGNKEPKTHRERLKIFLESSLDVNNFLGTLEYNEGNYAEAERYFTAASMLDEKSEQSQLNLMRSRFAQGRPSEAYRIMHKFYFKTGSKLSSEEMQEELERKELKVPAVEVKKERLFEILQ